MIPRYWPKEHPGLGQRPEVVSSLTCASVCAIETAQPQGRPDAPEQEAAMEKARREGGGGSSSGGPRRDGEKVRQSIDLFSAEGPAALGITPQKYPFLKSERLKREAGG